MSCFVELIAAVALSVGANGTTGFSVWLMFTPQSGLMAPEGRRIALDLNNVYLSPCSGSLGKHYSPELVRKFPTCFPSVKCRSIGPVGDSDYSLTICFG